MHMSCYSFIQNTYSIVYKFTQMNIALYNLDQTYKQMIMVKINYQNHRLMMMFHLPGVQMIKIKLQV